MPWKDDSSCGPSSQQRDHFCQNTQGYFRLIINFQILYRLAEAAKYKVSGNSEGYAHDKGFLWCLFLEPVMSLNNGRLMLISPKARKATRKWKQNWSGNLLLRVFLSLAVSVVGTDWFWGRTTSAETLMQKERLEFNILNNKTRRTCEWGNFVGFLSYLAIAREFWVL